MAILNRRLFLAGLSSVAGGCAMPKAVSPVVSTDTAQECDTWAAAKRIREQTVIPSFADRDFSITSFGAVGDGITDCTVAIAQAVQACHAQGGGRVVVPVGRFLTGSVHLLSNVNLHIMKGATLNFYTDPKRYLPEVLTRWEGMEFMGYSPLIYAHGQTNVALTGAGKLDGQASMENWWPWKGNKTWGRKGFPSQKAGRDQLMKDVEAGVPPQDRHYSEGYYFRPPFVQFYSCQNVLIEDVHIVRAPFWLLNPVLSENVTVRGVRLESLGPNSDGCDPESCKNVVIENCYFDTGDDCIAIKSGRNADGRRIGVAAENIVISGCQMLAGHGGVVIGSEISGGAKNVFVENCHMSSPDLERGIRLKTNSVRGGVIDGLYVRNVVIGTVQDAIVINYYYEEGDAGKFDPVVRNIHIENLLCQNAERVFQVRGFERAKIQNLQIRNAYFVKAGAEGVIENVERLTLENVNIGGKRYPSVT